MRASESKCGNLHILRRLGTVFGREATLMRQLGSMICLQRRTMMESRFVLSSLPMDISPRADVWLANRVFAMPASVRDYQKSWQDGWKLRLQIPRVAPTEMA